MVFVELVLLPLLLAGAGLAFIIFALNDKADGPSDERSRQLPTRQEHPLYHLHMRIRSSSKPSSASRASASGVAKLPHRRQSAVDGGSESGLAASPSWSPTSTSYRAHLRTVMLGMGFDPNLVATAAD